MGEGVFNKHCTVSENIFDAFHIHEIMYIVYSDNLDMRLEVEAF